MGAACRRRPYITKTLLVMKVTFLFLIVGLLNVSAEGLSQKVSYSAKDVPLERVFAQVKKQTGYAFFYEQETVSGIKPVTIQANNMPLPEFLNLLLESKPLQYKIVSKTIYISRKRPAASPGLPSTTTEIDIWSLADTLITVRGRVVDEKREPLPGVTVALKGTNRVTSTNDNGYFELKNTKVDVVVVSSVGYQTREISVTKSMLSSQNNFVVTLSRSESNLEEIAVTVNTGYQTIAQERATGAVTTLSSKMLESRFTPNILNNLEGRVAGLVNYGDRSMIRGTGTLFAESRPLLVVDGLPIEADFEDLNPYDIATVTVLKDAAAAAIYGARASNGVIVITTKKAPQPNKIDVEVSSNVMVWQKRNVDYADNWYMTPAQQVDLENDYYKWFYNEAPAAAANLTSTTNAIAGTGSHNLNITPIQYAHYQLKTGKINQDEVDSRLAQYRTQNFAKEYADHVLENKILQMHNVAVRNRTNNFQSNLVLNFKNDNMGKVTDNDRQLNVFYKGAYDMTKWMTINFSVNNIFQRTTERRGNYVENILDPFSLPAYYSMFNPDGSYANISPGWTHYYNPYATWVEDNGALRPMHYYLLDELKRNKHKIQRQSTRYQGELLLKIMEGLTVNTQYVYEVNRESMSNYSEEDSYLMRLMRNVYTIRNTNGTYRYLIPQSGGRLASENRQGDFWTARAQVNFNRVIAQDHAIDVIAGIEFRETNTKGTRNLYMGWDDQLQSQSTSTVNYSELWNINNTTWYASGYPARQFLFTPFFEDAINLNVAGNNLTEIRRRNGSGYANLTYTYDRRYNAFASVRKDYADVYGLATEFRGAPFGSAGVSWNINNEEFMSGVRDVNILKLRGSYGYTGNIYQGATSYMTATTGQINNNTGLPRATIESPGNPELSWEKTGTVNIGVEFILFNYRLRGMIDLYNKKSEKVFSNKTLESTRGFTSLVMNMANLRNKGVELTLAYDWVRPQNRGGFSWTTSTTASWNKNEVTRVEIQANTASQVIALGYKQGYPVRSLFSYRFAGLTDKGLQSWYAEDGRIIPDVGIASATPGSVYFTGQADPKYTVAMENRLAWKGLSLSMMMVYYGGHHLRANQIQINPFPGGVPVRSWYLNAWTPANKNTIVPGIWQYNASGGTQPSVQNNTDIFVHRADFLKIRNLVIGYDLAEKMVRKVGLNNLALRFQIDNLPAIWKHNDIDVDPETLGLPLQTCYVFGLNFRF